MATLQRKGNCPSLEDRDRIRATSKISLGGIQESRQQRGSNTWLFIRKRIRQHNKTASGVIQWDFAAIEINGTHEWVVENLREAEGDGAAARLPAQ